MAAQAQIKINGVAGSNDDLPYEDVVNLSNNDNTDVTTWAWTIIAKPAGSTANLSAPNVPAPTFTADAEGTYLIHLTVNSGLPDEASDQVIAGVRELQTGNRIPAAGETIENNTESDNTGWAHEAVDKILQRVTRMEDEGFITAVAAGPLTAGAIVKITDSVSVGTGTNVRTLPKIAAANATDWGSVNGVLGYLMGAAQGGTIVAGTICRVMLHGLLPFVPITGTFAVGWPVYINNSGAFSNIPGDNPRVVGTIAKIVSGGVSYSVYFAGYQSQQPYGSAGGDLTDLYPDPIVAKINRTTITTAGGSLATDKVLRVTGSDTADWGAVNLASLNAVSGILPVYCGGTGANMVLTPGALVYAQNSTKLAQTAVGTSGYLLKSNDTSAPSWIQTVPVANGGTGTSTAPTQYGVIYASSASVYASTAAATSTNTVLRGNNAGAPTWGTVPSGAFATASIPYNALQSAAASNQVSSGIVTVDTTSWTPLINYVDWPVKQGVFVFGIVPMFATAAIPSPVMLNKVTCLANNHSAKISVRYTITGPNDNWNPDGAVGFRNVRVYEQEFNFTQSSAGHIVGSVPFSMMTEFVPGGAEGNFSFLVEARINTAGNEKWELQYYRLRLAQG